MAILKIAKMGAPILGEVAKEVLDPTCEETASVASNMLETLIDAGGLGLAAPQVYISQRIIIIFRLSSREEELNYDDATNLLIMINPVIEPLSDEIDVDWEQPLWVQKRDAAPVIIAQLDAGNMRIMGVAKNISPV